MGKNAVDISYMTLEQRFSGFPNDMLEKPKELNHSQHILFCNLSEFLRILIVYIDCYRFCRTVLFLTCSKMHRKFPKTSLRQNPDVF